MKNNANGAQCYKWAAWYPLIGLTLTLVLSESFIAENPLLKQIVALASGWIPAINNLSTISDFPWLSGMYLAAMWTLFPLMVWWWAMNMPYNPAVVSTRPLLLALLFTPLGIMFLSTAIYWFPFHPDAQQIGFRAGRAGMFFNAILHSRLGFGLIFGAFFYFVSLLVMAWLRALWFYLLKTFRPK